MDRPMEKLLPQNSEAEAGMLGSLLIDPEAIVQVVSLVQPSDFYREAHRAIYQAMCDLHSDRQPADLITLCDELGRRGKLEPMGGASFVSSLANAVPTSRNVAQYARIVERTATLRRLIAAAGEIAGIAYSEPDADAAIEASLKLLSDATQRRGTADSVPIEAAIDAFLDEQLSAIETGKVAGVQTGFRLLDDHIRGVKPGELVYLAGETGSGKSAVAATMADAISAGIANDEVGCVEYITLEMRATQLVGRLLAGWAGVDSRTIRANFRKDDGTLNADAWGRIRGWAREAKEIRRGRLRFHATPVRFADIRALLTRSVLTRDCRAAFIDYLGLVTPDDPRQREYQRISNMSRELKQLALELNIPIFCLLQMNREHTHRANRRPQKSDLRDSGQLEQDADFIFGVYRGAVDLPKMAAADSCFAEFAELHILKAREGDANRVIPLRFEGPYTRFSNWPHEWDYSAYLRYTVADEPGGGTGE